MNSRLRELGRMIHRSAVGKNRCSGDIRLVVVTKTIDTGRILEAYQAGARDFGENRVQEWREKKEILPADIRWHLIGSLQTNKVKYVIGNVHLIHSLDRLELADEIERQARKKGIAGVPCLIQVNMSREDTKSGVDPGQIEKFLAGLGNYPSVKVKGLMTIGPLTEDETRIRDVFSKTRELFEALRLKYITYSWDILSMGMSSDYKIAIEEGSNMLRIGSLIFPREAK